METQSSRNKSVPQKLKADINESYNDSLLSEVLDNATGNDLSDDNSSAEELKEEGQYAVKNLAQGPKKNTAPDGDDVSSSSSGSGSDGEGVGVNAGSGGRRTRTPDQGLIHSSAEPILRLLTRLGIEKITASAL